MNYNQPPVNKTNIKYWEPDKNEICVFFDDFSEFRNMHYVISPYGGTDNDKGYHLANTNKVYYDNVQPLEFVLTMSMENFKHNH